MKVKPDNQSASIKSPGPSPNSARNIDRQKGRGDRNPALFQATVERLIREVQNLRGTFCAWQATEGHSTGNLFLQVCRPGLQSDMLIRLIRIFEDGKAASFWSLHRCDPNKIGKEIDISELKDLSRRLKSIRDKVFVHIDKRAVFDPERIYEEADLKTSEIKRAVEAAWTVLNQLYIEQTGRPFTHYPQSTLDSLAQDFRRDFAEIIGS